MKIGLVYKDENMKAKKLAFEVTSFLKQNGVDVLGEKNLDQSEYVISLGGDGTLINKACKYAEIAVPFIGINTGNLGFLTAAEGDEWKEAVLKLIKGDLIVSERIALEAKVVGKSETFRAVNEYTIKSQFRVADLEVKVNEKDFLKVYGDGVIVSTQSGSTAYSLSAGGPIVDPNLNCILVTPVNPIGLPVPSAVLSPNSLVDIKLLKGEDIYLVVDGQQSLRLKVGDVVRVKQAKNGVKFGYFDQNHFFKSLNAKFGLSKRREA